MDHVFYYPIFSWNVYIDTFTDSELQFSSRYAVFSLLLNCFEPIILKRMLYGVFNGFLERVVKGKHYDLFQIPTGTMRDVNNGQRFLK
jgi:hypothetical protein